MGWIQSGAGVSLYLIQMKKHSLLGGIPSKESLESEFEGRKSAGY